MTALGGFNLSPAEAQVALLRQIELLSVVWILGFGINPKRKKGLWMKVVLATITSTLPPRLTHMLSLCQDIERLCVLTLSSLSFPKSPKTSHRVLLQFLLAYLLSCHIYNSMSKFVHPLTNSTF